MNYRFHLEKYHAGSKLQCPQCGRKACFTRYIDEQGEVTFPDSVGKCDHENSCGYHFTPKEYFRDNPEAAASTGKATDKEEPSPSLPGFKDIAPSFIDKSVMERTLSHYGINPLYSYLAKSIGKENTDRLFRLYRVGTSKKGNGSTVFWQVDAGGNVHAGKIMLYDAATGHRVKEPRPFVCWVHSELKMQDFRLRQCFFGEHLLPCHPDKTVFVVESEKTALIAAHFMPDGIWLATGGKHGCFNESAVHFLSGRNVVLMPDLGATEKWREKSAVLKPICKSVIVSDALEQMATDEQRKQGLDIADFLLQTDTPQMVLQRMIDRNPAVQLLIDKFGLEIDDSP